MAYVTLEQAKDHLRVDFDDDDVYISDLIEVAQQSVLNEVEGSFPGDGEVTTAGTTALTGSDTLFTELTVGDTIKVEGETSRVIATIVSDTSLTVSLAFSTSDSGLTYSITPTVLISGVLPKPLYQAILLMVGQLYAQREPVIAGVGVMKVPYTLEYLIAPYKTWVIK